MLNKLIEKLRNWFKPAPKETYVETITSEDLFLDGEQPEDLWK